MSTSVQCIYNIINPHYDLTLGPSLVVMVWKLDLQLPVQSVSIAIKIVSSNLVHGEVYSIQHYVKKFVSDLLTGRWFSLGTPPIKLTPMI